MSSTLCFRSFGSLRIKVLCLFFIFSSPLLGKFSGRDYLEIPEFQLGILFEVLYVTCNEEFGIACQSKLNEKIVVFILEIRAEQEISVERPAYEGQEGENLFNILFCELHQLQVLFPF